MKAKQQHSPFLSWVPPMRLFNDLGSWPSEAQERGLLTSQHLINTYLLRRRLNYCCSIAKSCPTLCDPMDCSTPSFPVLHYLLEFAQTHVHWVSDAILSSHFLLPASPPTLTLSQHQGLFQWSALHIRWPKYWGFSFSISPNEYPRSNSFRID